ATGTFYTANGQVIGPNGTTFVARGIDAMQGNEPSVNTLQNDFPGINFLRLAVYDYASPASLASYVNSMTSQGIVVELEDHNNGASNAGGSGGTIFTGATLSNELNWFSSIATAFKSNPYVWFGTNNEPSEIDASGNTNAAALSTWQQQTVQAVRDTGNNSPVMVEMNSWGPGKTAVGYTQSSYSGLHNIIWDAHYYGWLSGYSTDQATVSNTLSTIASEAQQLTSADGKMPVIIGEYGNSTTGGAVDANGTQVVAAVLQSGLGNVAWAWGAGNPGDGLSDGGSGLSSYGRQVAAGIAAAASASPPTPDSVRTPVSVSAPALLLALTASVPANDAAQAASMFTVTDTTTKGTSASAGHSYSGPVAGIQYDYITTTSDSLALTTRSPNWFIHTGSGDDAIDVSTGSGSNVLDGSTGSNFLVGGSGSDTFFLDDRGPTADLWSTVVGFHSGDNATIWGITPASSEVSTHDNQGAPGYTGVDFGFTSSGLPNANLTLAGFSSADLSNGRLTVSYGTTPDSSFMLIHAN
ncbi:MAG: mannan endo,4-beta-mannosidase, partial [Acetobacteraceae bacterium]|nr:mannan endo,4-beta-mannosidase [Acetobacteraceae bacterium]